MRLGPGRFGVGIALVRIDGLGRLTARIAAARITLEKADHAERVRLFDERIKHWLSNGAVATDRVAKFLGKAGLAPMPEFREQPKQSAPKKKAQERAAAAAANG